MMHACSYLVLSTPLSLNMWTHLLSSAFAWGQARSKLGGVDTSILHHVFMLIFIASFAVISLHGTILMPFLSYFARFTWGGRMSAAGILAWKWSKVEIPILCNSKRRKNQRGCFSGFIRNTGPKKHQRGASRWPQASTTRPPPRSRHGGLWAAHWPTSPPLFLYDASWPGKNHTGAFSWFRRCHEAELEQIKSRALAGRSCRGNFPPGGGNRRHCHHQHSSRRRGGIFINIFISTSSSPIPSSSLVTNLCLATQIGTCKVASSVDYSL